jgi:ubiquinone/menaquinone biosynthesis C-methylase UbiE
MNMNRTGDSGETVGRLIDPWQQVDASEDVDRLIQILEERGATVALAEIRGRWLDFADVRPGYRVLDLGCGTGVVTRDLGRRVGERGRVVGVDRSRHLIQEAVRRATGQGLEGRIEFQSADGADLPFPNESFDLVIASAVFSHIPNGLEVLVEMTRVTRSGGTVAVFDHDIDTIVVNASDRELSRRIIHAYCDRYFTSGWAGRELYALFRQVALEDVHSLPMILSSTNYESYWQQMVERSSTVAVKTGVVSQEEAEAWRADLEQKGREGRFFGCRNYYCLRGRKPPSP